MKLTLRIGVILLLVGRAWAAEPRARNVVLFLGDAGGIPTLNAAGIYAHDKPQTLFIQHMPHIALADTSSADSWVTDSAAGMTAIVTGQKTNNGTLSQLPGGEGAEGRPLKTILEYAEERGLATGVVTNMPVCDATPAACYAHASSRKSTGEIFQQVFTPRFGDGVDVLIGADRMRLFPLLEKAGIDGPAAFAKAGYRFFDAPSAISPEATRAASVYDGGDFGPQPVIDTVLQILSRNPRGFFLMVEWDMHTGNLQKGLDRVIVMDELVRHVAGRVSPDTLIIYAADHSFDLRLRSGKKHVSLAQQLAMADEGDAAKKSAIRVDGSHSGEEVLIAAQGPGAERVHGFIPNTEIFEIMMSAYGWSRQP